MNIISASRRTDIPAFYSRWLMGRLRAGAARYPNPITGQMITVSLRPEDVHSFVFWSKHYGPLLEHLDELHARGYRACFHYTITALPRTLEPHTPDWERSAEICRALAARTSPRHVFWRFDPILFTDELGAAHYLERFAALAAALEGATERCIFSFAAFYGKAQRRLSAAAIQYRDPPLDEKRALAERLAEIAGVHGMTLHACCQDALVGGDVLKAHCIDGELLAALFPDQPAITQAGGTRPECGCTASRDIGAYDTCPFGCLYCYANGRPELADARHRAHREESDALA